MTTHAQINANRANAKNSSGPKTEAGKLASSRNSLRHGCTSKQIVISGEDPAEYEALRMELHNDFNPANTTEAALVDQIAQHTWRLQRCRRAETGAFERLLKLSQSDFAVANAISSPEAQLDKIRRYEVTIERSYRAIDQLRKLQKERRALETVAAKEEQRASLERRWVDPPRDARDADKQTGFVSQAGAGGEASAEQHGFVSQADARTAPQPDAAAAA